MSEPEMTDRERRKRSKEVYETVLRCVDFNSGHKQPPLAKRSAIIQSVHTSGHGRYSLEETHRAIQAARSNGDLWQVEDDEGDARLGIDDPETLREKIETNLSRVENPRRDVIGLANQRIQHLRDDGGDT